METQTYQITKKIETLKKGDLFKKKGQKQILIYDGYCRYNKAYQYTKYEDMSASGYIKKGTIVVIEDENF